MKIIGKPYSGKPNVRFDEGELEIEHTATTPALYSTNLMNKGYKVHLANTTAIQKYNGLKHSEDKEDAFWLAELLRLDILPEGHIYPNEERPIRDLPRKRSHLVRLRTSLILSLHNIIDRSCGTRIKVNDIKKRNEDFSCNEFR